jgi:NhaA family Na+:H+ antiporter
MTAYGGFSVDTSTALGIPAQRLKSTLPITCALLALALANSPWSDSYFGLIDRTISFQIGGFWISRPSTFYIHHGLMAVVVLALTLRVKRAIILGRSASRAAPRTLDVVDAIENAILLGLMAIALIAAWLAAGTTTVAGDGLATTAIIALLVLCSAAGISSNAAYIALGVALAFFTAKDSLHPAVAAVFLGLIIPSWKRIDPVAFPIEVRTALSDFEQVWPFTDPGPSEPQQQEAMDEIAGAVRQAQSPLIRLEQAITPFAAFWIVPLFVISSAGVALANGGWEALMWPVVIGVAFAVVASKLVLRVLSSRLGVATGSITDASRSGPPIDFGLRDADALRFVGGLFVVVSVFGDTSFRDSAVLGLIGGSVSLAAAATVVAVRGKGRGDDTRVIPFPIRARPARQSRA